MTSSSSFTSTSSASPHNESASPSASSSNTTMSIQHDRVKISNPDFTGKWRLKSNEGLDDYLKSEGWNWMMRKAISKLGHDDLYIYHHHVHRTSRSPVDTSLSTSACAENTAAAADEEEEHISIKSVSKGGMYELIRCANLHDKREVVYKDKNGYRAISVFKWSKDKSEIIEFLLKDSNTSSTKNDTLYVSPFAPSPASSSSTSSSHHRSRRSRPSRQKSYTRCWYLDTLGQLVLTVTNQSGKHCTSVYHRDDDISIQQLKQTLHLVLDDENGDDEKQRNIDDALQGRFPRNIQAVQCSVAQQEMDGLDEKLNLQNVVIQRELESITAQMQRLQELLIVKTQELQSNIAKNDENVRLKNLVAKWTEFEASWGQWDTRSFLAWLQRCRWHGKGFEAYKIYAASVDAYCVTRFQSLAFKGEFLQKFDRDAVRQIGVENEEDSMCIYQQIVALVKKYPIQIHVNENEERSKLNGIEMS